MDPGAPGCDDSHAQSDRDAEDGPQRPNIIIHAPAEDGVPPYRVEFERRRRHGQSVLVHPPEGSLLPSIRTRYIKTQDEEDYIHEWPIPVWERWRPPAKPDKPTRPLKSFFWPPPTGDPDHPASLLTMHLPHREPGPPRVAEGNEGTGWYRKPLRPVFSPVNRALPTIDTVLEEGLTMPVCQISPQLHVIML